MTDPFKAAQAAHDNAVPDWYWNDVDYDTWISDMLARDEITEEKAKWLLEKVNDYELGKITKSELGNYFDVPF